MRDVIAGRSKVDDVVEGRGPMDRVLRAGVECRKGPAVLDRGRVIV